MQIFHLMLYKKPQIIQDLDDYQVKKFGCHIEVQKEEEFQPVNYDFKLEPLEELEKIMRQPPKHWRPPK